MSAAAHTRLLLAAVLATAAADGVARWLDRPTPQEALPSLPGFDPDAATRVTLGRADAPLVLEEEGDDWQLVAPTEAPADPGEVGALLAAFSGGVRAEARVDDADHERYGLSGGTELRLDVDGAEGSLLSVVVGNDGGGGTTWVRFPGADDVYRARIGGRSLLDRPPGAWRDRRVTDVDPASISALEATWTGGAVSARRDGAGWTGTPPVDDPTLERLVQELARLRAAEVTAADRPIDWDLATVRLARADGDVVLTFGRSGPLRYVRRADREDVWRLAVPWIDRLADPATYIERTLWTVREADRIVIRAPGRDGVLERTAQGWRVVRPANVDVDPQRAEAVVAFLSEPRVIRFEAARDPGFAGDHSWTVRAGDVERTVEIGRVEADRAWVRDRSAPDRVGWIEPKTVAAIEGLFGG